MLTGIIYRAICLVNGKSYIGQTITQMAYRKRKHCTGKEGTGLSRAINKYGAANFRWEILAELEEVGLDAAEQFYIAFFGTLAPKGYNLTTGGQSNGEMSDQTKKLIGVKNTGKPNYFKGKKRGSPSAATIAKMSASAKKRRATPQQRANQSVAITKWWATRKAGV